MKNTVTMAELMKKVNAYGQPQNLDEGFVRCTKDEDNVCTRI